MLAELGPSAKVLAGGQSLVPVLAMRLAAPAHLVDINGIGELDTVVADADGVTVGALARHSRVEHDAAADRAQPLLAQALRLVAHPTIRNRGTTVGSLAHADPAGEMTAVLALCGGSVTAASSRRPSGDRRRRLLPRPAGVGTAARRTGHRTRSSRRCRRRRVAPSSRSPGATAITRSAGSAPSPNWTTVGVVRSLRCAYLSVSDTPLVLDLTRGWAAGEDDAAERARGGRRSAVGPARHRGLPPASGRCADRFARPGRRSRLRGRQWRAA